MKSAANSLGFKVLLLVLAVCLSFIAAISIGSASISASDAYQCLLGECSSRMVETVIWQIRVPRVMLGFIVGAGLACAGAVLQNTTRNPLADPYLFGIVAGAGLGATIANTFFAQQIAFMLPAMAFVGAAMAILLVLFLARFLFRVELILLAGVAVAFMLGSMSQFLLYVGEPLASNRIMFWLMGSLAGAEMEQVKLLLPLLMVLLGLVLLVHRQMDAMLLDEDSARTLGVNVPRLRMLLLLGCALMTAAIVAYCGGIGFVGLMVPHMVRFLFGVTSFKLLIGCFFLGGIFLMWVDVLARQLLSGQELPIGIITSAIGSIFFVLLMLRSKATR